jgi:hypothetical protein
MTHDKRHEVSLCGVPIRIAQHCRSVADATIQTANREPLPIPMPNTINPTKTKLQVIHRTPFIAPVFLRIMHTKIHTLNTR